MGTHTVVHFATSGEMSNVTVSGDRSHGTITVNWPGTIIEIDPPKAQIAFEELFNAGLLPIMTVGDPGTHGPGTLGMQGIGVNTPIAAAVAAATCGFAIDMHMPNGAMLTIGLLSMIVAAAGPPALTIPTGKTFNADGAAPNVHIICAPDDTRMPIRHPPRWLRWL